MRYYITQMDVGNYKYHKLDGLDVPSFRLLLLSCFNDDYKFVFSNWMVHSNLVKNCFLLLQIGRLISLELLITVWRNLLGCYHLCFLPKASFRSCWFIAN